MSLRKVLAKRLGFVISTKTGTDQFKMPSAGLSLVGFLDPTDAIKHFRTLCVPDDPNRSDTDLISDWNDARQALAPAPSNAGNPHIQPIPNTDPHILDLLKNSPFGPQLTQIVSAGASFANVEAALLLAFQHVVDTDRSTHHCKQLTGTPTTAELYDLCLPVSPKQDPVHISFQPQSAMLRSRNLGVRMVAQGPLGPNTIGIHFGLSLPMVHVVRFNGRCYLHNGFHRVYGAWVAGATHVPCLFRDVADVNEVGLQGDSTFALPLLESGNPPTVWHFTAGGAWPVKLRAVSRFLQVNWSDHVMAEE